MRILPRLWLLALASTLCARAADLVRPLVWTLDDQPAYRNDALGQAGYLSVTRFGANPSGNTDATHAIQPCIDEAFRHHLACYFPAGTYLVSATPALPVTRAADDRRPRASPSRAWPTGESAARNSR